MPDRKWTYDADGFATKHFLGFRTDDKFTRSFQTALKSITLGDFTNNLKLKDLEWRAHICTWAANQSLKTEEGDFVECGVWHGLLSKSICEYVDVEEFNNRKFFLVDTFGEMKGSHPHPRYRFDIYDDVKKRFAKYPYVEVIRGRVPEILPQINSTKIAYLAIDLNSHEPELKALEYFYPKMVKGGIIYLDDYGWKFPQLRNSVDKFLADKPETLLHFPSGNSIVVKT